MELWHTSIKTIKQQEMIAKINKNFASTATLEDVEERIRVMRKGKIPFAVASCISYLFVVCNYSRNLQGRG
jgi:hypothetical protein